MPVLSIGGIPITFNNGYVLGDIETGVAPVNTVAPTVSGDTAIGSVLTATTGTWTGDPAPTFTYQWQRAGTPISGATASTYTTTAPDADQAITCEVTATNSQGSASAVSSNSITPAAGGPTLVQLSGTYGITRGDLAGGASTLTLEIRCSWTVAGQALQFMSSNSSSFDRRADNQLGVYTEDIGGGVFQTGGSFGTSGGLVTVRYEIDPAGGLAGGNTLRILVDGTPIITSSASGSSVNTFLYFFQDGSGNNRFQGQVEYLTLWLGGVQTIDIRGNAAVWNNATGATGTVTDV